MSRVAELLRNRFERYLLEPGLVAWVYEFRNRAPVFIPRFVSNAFELGVQLRGDWQHDGSRTGTRLYSPGMIHSISPGEHFDYQFHTSCDPGVVVGFSIDPHHLVRPGSLSRNMVLSKKVALRDDPLLRLAAAFKSAHDRGSKLSADEVRANVEKFVMRHVEQLPRDSVLEAKEALERHFDRPLYMAQLAEVAELNGETFTRTFSRRFGLTPARYRHELRLNEALLLAWSRRELSIAEIARRVGFEDLSYFHRTFHAKFRLTPAQASRRIGISASSLCGSERSAAKRCA